jgi:hypothetical protein
MADTRDFKRLFGRDQDRRFLGNMFIDVFKRFVVPHYPTGLSAFVVAAETGAGRDADESIELQTAFHEDIKDTGGKKAAHPSAFKNEPRFYR